MAAKSKFKIGDSVQLKSGEPVGTVTSFEIAGMGDEVNTTWIVKGKQVHGSFPADALVICKKKEK